MDVQAPKSFLLQELDSLTRALGPRWGLQLLTLLEARPVVHPTFLDLATTLTV